MRYYHRMLDFSKITPQKSQRAPTWSQELTILPKTPAMESISDKTLRSICDFVATDYYIFDFEVPKACLVLFD